MNVLLKIIGTFFSIVSIALAGYSLITQNFEFMPYMMFSAGVTMLVAGLNELQRKPKSSWGYMNIAVSLFMFFVSIMFLIELMQLL